jgi:DNA-binding transcriptional MerR regulator
MRELVGNFLELMRTLKTSEAATLLNVSPNTLRSWERRFGYPRPKRSPGRHRLYVESDIASLRHALASGLSISSAISVARDGLRGGGDALIGALSAFDGAGADEAMESALGLRSLERSVEEVLLPSLEKIGGRSGHDSAQWGFAARWAGDWLRRAVRFAYPVTPVSAVVIGDATRDDCDPDAPHLRAFELACVRSGQRPLCLPVRSIGALGEVAGVIEPSAIVIAGAFAPNEDVARFAYAARAASGPLPVALYRRPRKEGSVRRASVTSLSNEPLAAHAELMAVMAPADEVDMERVTAPVAPVPEVRSA